MSIDPDHFERTCAEIANAIDHKLEDAFPDEHIGYVVVFRDFGGSGFSLSASNVREDKVEEIFIKTLNKTREVQPKPLASIIPNPFDSLGKNPRD